MKPILVYILTIFIISCSSKNNEDAKTDLCATRYQCRQVIQEKVNQYLEFPADVENFGIIKLYLNLKEDGTAGTYQPMSKYNPKLHNNYIVKAVRSASPFVEVQHQLKLNHDEYDSYYLYFYDRRLDKIYNNGIFDSVAAENNIDFLKLFSKENIVQVFGQPKEVSQCTNVVKESFDCLKYDDVQISGGKQAAQLVFLFKNKELYAYSYSYPEDINSVRSNIIGEENIYNAESTADFIKAIGHPHLVVLDKGVGNLTFQYFYPIRRDDTAYPAFRVYYRNGTYSGISFVLKGKYKLN